MLKNVDEYLLELKKELKGSDSALIQDALSDAEEYLRTALENALEDVFSCVILWVCFSRENKLNGSVRIK